MQDEAKYFEILLNHKGELAFIIAAEDDEPVKPKLIFDGNEEAIFFRTESHSIKLNQIHLAAQKFLKEQSQVLFAEIKDGEVKREYEVAVKTVGRLPK